MKSMSSKALSAFVLVMSFGTWTAVTPGGVSAPASSSTGTAKVVVPTDENQRPPGEDELPTAKNSSQRVRASSVIKCWQDGRLIFNEHNWKPAGQSGISDTLFNSNSDPHARLQLMQFGDTFCMLKDSANK